MKNRRASLSILAFVASILMCAPVQAVGLFRAYLSSNGLDTNPCTVVAPCRLLPAALAAVTSGGEIWILDSANYNIATVNITKSVSILAIPGAVGSVVAIAGPAISLATAGISVALRNLVIVPFPGGGGDHGIVVTGALRLSVEDSLISGLASTGIYVITPTAVRVTNCIIRDNGAYGVIITGGATATISNAKILGNSQGGIAVFASDNAATSAAISDSVLSGNSFGLDVQSGVTPSNVTASITRSTLSNNFVSGISASSFAAGATVVVTAGSNMITKNASYGLSQSGAEATLESLGNNINRQNGSPFFGTITTVLGQ